MKEETIFISVAVFALTFIFVFWTTVAYIALHFVLKFW